MILVPLNAARGTMTRWPSGRGDWKWPAEGVGGPRGYREFLDALADPDHEDTPSGWNGSAVRSTPPWSRKPQARRPNGYGLSASHLRDQRSRGQRDRRSPPELWTGGSRHRPASCKGCARCDRPARATVVVKAHCRGVTLSSPRQDLKRISLIDMSPHAR